VALQLQDNIGEMRQAADTGRKNFDEAIQRIEKESTSKVLVLEKEQKDLGQSLAHLDEPLKRSYGSASDQSSKRDHASGSREGKDRSRRSNQED